MEAKVSYRIADDSFEIYVRRSEDSEWEFYQSCTCVSTGRDPETNYIHYDFMMSIVQLANLGYKIINGGNIIFGRDF